MEACLHEVLRCSTATVTPASLSSAAPHLQPAAGRRLLHRLAGVVHQLDAAAEEDRCTQLSDIVELCMALWGKLDQNWLEDMGTWVPAVSIRGYQLFVYVGTSCSYM